MKVLLGLELTTWLVDLLTLVEAVAFQTLLELVAQRFTGRDRTCNDGRIRAPALVGGNRRIGAAALVGGNRRVGTTALVGGYGRRVAGGPRGAFSALPVLGEHDVSAAAGEPNYAQHNAKAKRFHPGQAIRKVSIGLLFEGEGDFPANVVAKQRAKLHRRIDTALHEQERLVGGAGKCLHLTNQLVVPNRARHVAS